MSLEAKVGAFVVAGLALMGSSIFLLGDYTLEQRYTISATFQDVANLNKNAPVKLAGVEVGQVREIVLEGDLARVIATIRKGVAIYKDAEFSIGMTGIIGSKYLQIDQGHAYSGVIPAGSTIRGTDPVSMEKKLTQALNSLQDVLNDLNRGGPGGSLVDNLRATMANVRDLTANLNDLVESTRPKLEKAADRTDEITDKLDQLLAKTNQVMASLTTSSGTVGALLHDEKMKDDVQKTVASVKEAAKTANDVLGRMTQFKAYWNLDWRYEHLARAGRADVGLTIVPREGRYYYIGGANIANVSDATRDKDYVQKNRIDALLGFVYGPFDLGLGVLRSGGGARLTVTPFYRYAFGKRFSVMAQGYDFSRDRTINGRHFTHPEYDFAILARINRFFGVGGRVEDVQETKRYQTWANLTFEDKDIAYLVGVVSYGAASAKGQSKD